MTKLTSQYRNLEKVLQRLDESLKKPKNNINRNSAIKRFEMSFDLVWKTLKTFLEENHNAICASPQNCFRETYRVGVIEYDTFWLEIAKMRNLSVHAYDEKLADDIYSELPKVYQYFQKLFSAIKPVS